MLEATHASSNKVNFSADPHAGDRGSSSLTDLRADIEALKAAAAAREDRIRLLEEENAWLKARLWGRSCERSSPIELSPDQWQLVFNEAEARTFAAAAEPETTRVAAHERVKRGRRRLPEGLERVPVIYELPESERVCPHDGTVLEVMDREVSESYHFQPARAWVSEEVRLTYSCPCCRGHVVTAPGPAKLLPKSVASPELLAHVVTTKFLDAVPLNRQVEQLERYGIELTAQTLSNWMVRIGTEAIVPLRNLMIERALEAPLTYMDETTLQVLESEKSPTSEHYMWVRVAVWPAHSSEPERRIVLFDYAPYRNGETLARLLEGYRGALVTDALELYDRYANAQGLVHGLCNVHARRGFEEAREIAEGKKGKGAPAEEHSPAARARVALDVYRELYRIEREIKSLPPDQKKAARQARSAPVMAAFKDWLEQMQPKVWSEGKLGKAIAYALRHFEKLCVFLEHPEMDPDTNAVERIIRRFVVGRNNWMLHKSQAGATASASLYSLVITASLNDLEPYAYLNHLFRQLPAARTVEDFEALLPWNVKDALARGPPH